ncbi:MAG: tRNA-dihydrouridine synthase [bacterium]
MPINNFWKDKIKFKDMQVPRIMSAPIDGVIDSPLRQLIRNFSQDNLLFGQMRHVATVTNAPNLDEFNVDKIEHPVAFQIAVNTTDFIESAIEKILEQDFFDMINLNSGCPAKKIAGAGAGCALMGQIPLLEKIIKITKKSIGNKIPFTIKIRAGFKEKNALEVSLMAQDLGIDGIIIHPRLKDQGFTGELDFDLVRKIKDQVKVPVIFSGNIVDADSAKKTYEFTGVDGLMIGRALYGAPWKLEEIYQGLLGNVFEISEKEKIKVALKHLELNSKHYGDKVGFNILKKHLPMYIKGIDGAALIRNQLVMAENEEVMREILKTLITKL